MIRPLRVGIVWLMRWRRWVSNNKLAWTIQAAGLGADPGVNISARPIPLEPMVRGYAHHSIFVILNVL